MEIYFHNLDKETQKEVLKEFGYKTAEDGNWDSFPLFILEGE